MTSPKHTANVSAKLRYGRGRWRAWEPVGNDPTYAVTAKLKREKALDAANFGVALKDEPQYQNLVKICDAVTEFLTDRQMQKARKTYAESKLVLGGFTDSLNAAPKYTWTKSTGATFWTS